MWAGPKRAKAGRDAPDATAYPQRSLLVRKPCEYSSESHAEIPSWGRHDLSAFSSAVQKTDVWSRQTREHYIWDVKSAIERNGDRKWHRSKTVSLLSTLSQIQMKYTHTHTHTHTYTHTHGHTKPSTICAKRQLLAIQSLGITLAPRHEKPIRCQSKQSRDPGMTWGSQHPFTQNTQEPWKRQGHMLCCVEVI